MSLKKYLKDKSSYIVFYFLLMTFMSFIIYLDGTIKVHISNIIYINIVGIVFFILYLLIGFIKKKNHYEFAQDILKGKIENLDEYSIVEALPNSTNYDEEVYIELIKILHKIEKDKINKMYKDKKENKEFTLSWVHEIKTPIAASRLILDNSIGKSVDYVVDKIENEIDKIDEFVEQALYYSRAGSFSKDYFVTEFKLEEVIKTSIKKHAKIFINKRINMKMDNLDIYVSSDKKWLLYIVDQILSNALKYTDSEGEILIKAEKNSKESKLIIKDNGTGIRKEDIERVFEKGFTGYNGRENYKSTGLGLYLAKKLSKKLGHNITLKSVLNEYTEVTVHFPKLIEFYNEVR